MKLNCKVGKKHQILLVNSGLIKACYGCVYYTKVNGCTYSKAHPDGENMCDSTYFYQLKEI